MSAPMLVAFTAVMLVALSWDLVARRIPNGVILVGLALALGLRALPGGPLLGDGISGGALGFAAGLVGFVLRGIGGGDVKLLAVAGAFLGPVGALAALLLSGLVGGGIGVVAALRGRSLGRVLRSTGALIAFGATLGRAGRRPTLESPGAVTVPYGVAIALGSLLSGFLPWLARP